MSLDEADIRALTETIWDTVLTLRVQNMADDAEIQSSEGLLTSCVQITGNWEGAVAIHCTATLARKAAMAVFGGMPDDIGNEEMKDILGELANITGGNVKMRLPGPCQLSLPSIVEGSDYRFNVLGSELLIKARFRCLGEPFQVTVYQKHETIHQGPDNGSKA